MARKNETLSTAGYEDAQLPGMEDIPADADNAVAAPDFTVGDPVQSSTDPVDLPPAVVALVDKARQSPTLWFPIQTTVEKDKSIRDAIRAASRQKGYTSRFRPGKPDGTGKFKVKVVQKDDMSEGLA